MSLSLAPEAGYVDAELNYLQPTTLRPVNYAVTPPSGVPQRGGEVDTRRVRIFDARRATQAPSLDRNGFEVRAHHSEVSDFTDDARIRSTYYAEAETLIYDSRTDGTARLTAHTAFEDPSSPLGAPHRRSIELRTLVFWE